MRLDDNGAAGGQRRCRVAACHRKGQGEIAGTEHGDRPNRNTHLSDIRLRSRLSMRIAPIDPRPQKVTLAHHRAEQPELAGGTRELAASTGLGQPCLLRHPFSEGVDGAIQLVGNRLQ